MQLTYFISKGPSISVYTTTNIKQLQEAYVCSSVTKT